MESVLLNNEPICFLPFFQESVVYGLEEQILQALDDGEPHGLLYVWLSNIAIRHAPFTLEQFIMLGYTSILFIVLYIPLQFVFIHH